MPPKGRRASNPCGDGAALPPDERMERRDLSRSSVTLCVKITRAVAGTVGGWLGGKMFIDLSDDDEAAFDEGAKSPPQQQ